MKKFSNKSLGISISYPESWQEISGPWIKNFLGKAKLTSEKLQVHLQECQGFVLVVHDCNVKVGLPFPTLKCRIYDIFSVKAGGGLHAVLEQLNKIGKQSHQDFELLEYTKEYLVAGVIGARVMSRMTILNEHGEEFPTMTESLYLPTSRYLICVSLSATSIMDFRPVDVFENIVKSIRLD
jgi:hypothetical protein